MGGQEFVNILPECLPDRAISIVEALRTSMGVRAEAANVLTYSARNPSISNSTTAKSLT